MTNLLCSWSGGKDSCYALMLALSSGQHNLKAVMTMMNENNLVSRSHALPYSILQQHAQQLKVPLVTANATWDDYENEFIATLKTIKKEHATQVMVFGDIDIIYHKEWEEKVCHHSGHTALLPLWQRARKPLVLDMIDAGIEAIICSCNMQLGTRFLGRTINHELVEELEQLGVDVCGENGEFHTLVINCPLFSNGINLPKHTKAIHNDYCFLVWEDA